MFTLTKDLILPSTVTGSWPRPRWFDTSMWGKTLDTCMMDVRFREKFQDALAVVVNDQERAGLDILTNGDYHLDEDMAGRSWHHYPLQRWTGLTGDYMQAAETRSAWLRYPPGTLLYEIYTGWRWPQVTENGAMPGRCVDRGDARPEPARDRIVRAVQGLEEEGLHRRGEPPHAPGRPA